MNKTTHQIPSKHGLLAMATVLLLVIFSGCASRYTIVMTNGSMIHTKDEPKLNKKAGFYQFTDATGREMQVNKDQIQRIEKDR